MRTRIKICGITNIDDALMAAELGADALGFVFAESPRQISFDAAAKIIRRLPPFIRTVGVFTEESPIVAEIARCVPLDLIQLHGDQTEEFAESLGASRVIRAVRVSEESSLERLKMRLACTSVLLDTYDPKQKGGTGTTFNWDLAVIAKRYGKPIILAGGLNPANIIQAIQTVHPYGVDVSSGVEAEPGKKDLTKLKELIDNVRSADTKS